MTFNHTVENVHDEPIVTLRTFKLDDKARFICIRQTMSTAAEAQWVPWTLVLTDWDGNAHSYYGEHKTYGMLDVNMYISKSMFPFIDDVGQEYTIDFEVLTPYTEEPQDPQHAIGRLSLDQWLCRGDLITFSMAL